MVLIIQCICICACDFFPSHVLLCSEVHRNSVQREAPYCLKQLAKARLCPLPFAHALPGTTLVSAYGHASLGPRWWQMGSDRPSARTGSGGGGSGVAAAEWGGEESDDDDDESGLGGRFWSSLTI